MWGLKHFRLFIYGKPIELLTDHQALEPLIKRNRTNKTYSERLTRGLDRLAGSFRYKYQTFRRKTLNTNRLSEQKSNFKTRTDRKLRRRVCINCILPLLEFINNYGSVASQKKLEARTDQNEQREKPSTNQSEADQTNQSQKRTKQTNAVHRYHIQVQSIQINSIPFKPFKKQQWTSDEWNKSEKKTIQKKHQT